MNIYATLDQYHAEKAVQTALASLTSAQRMKILEALEEASRRIDTFCSRHFYPLIVARPYDYQNAREIRFSPYDLLEATTVTTGGGDTEIESTDYDLLTGGSYGLYPKTRLLMHSDASASLDIGDRYEQANNVTGIWGYNENWDAAWLSSLDTVQDDPLTAAATTLTVSDADGLDAKGISPRFQVGQMLSIEDEYLYVAGVTAGTTNELTVVRAENGSTAAAHVQDTAITVYQPQADIKKACLIIAAYFKVLPDAPFGTVQTLETSYQMKLTIPETAVEILAPYQDMGLALPRPQTTGRMYPNGIDPWAGL